MNSASGKYLHSLFHDAKKYGDKAAKNFKEEDVHEWRVTVKKMKAAFLFLQFFRKSLKDEVLKPLKRIFKRAGKIRELQLLQEAIEKFRTAKFAEPKKKLLRQLHGDEKKGEKKFRKRFPDEHKNVVTDLEKEMDEAHEKVQPDEVSKYFRQKLATILELMRREKLSVEEYHELRKHLKELKYNLSFGNDASKKMVFAVFTEKQLTALEEALGKWHDQIIISARLKDISSEASVEKDIADFTTVAINRTERRAEQMILKIRKQLDMKLKSIEEKVS